MSAPRAYYNENDPFAAAWLESLIREGHIMEGDVDTRSIEDVAPQDLDGFTRCHFFAGIGGWDLALQIAGWPESRPVWTGSCPCQPFSSAGKRKGTDDERHLFPAWAVLIEARRPPAVFGEQVASADGRSWLSSVRDTLEHLGYAVGAADLCAAGVGAPHIRQRLYWGGLAHDDGAGCSRLQEREQQSPQEQQAQRRDDADRCHVVNPWADLTWVECSDGRARPVPPAESGVQPLAHGVPGRVGQLRAYGNAIVPQLAAEFVRAVA